jgi:hypothetical protein
MLPLMRMAEFSSLLALSCFDFALFPVPSEPAWMRLASIDTKGAGKTDFAK